jgi:hypothetical protein
MRACVRVVWCGAVCACVRVCGVLFLQRWGTDLNHNDRPAIRIEHRLDDRQELVFPILIRERHVRFGICPDGDTVMMGVHVTEGGRRVVAV